MAARSFFITVLNFTGKLWQRSNLVLESGEWSNNGGFVPPEQIPKISLDGNGDAIPGVARFGSESDGFATGTNGSVQYQSDGGSRIYIGWNNPFVGSNGFSVGATNGLKIVSNDFTGDNANVTVTVSKG